MKKPCLLLLVSAMLSMLCVSVYAYSGGILSPAMRILSEDEMMIKSGLVSGNITFSESDFSHAVGCSVDYITITALPPASEGTLYFGDAPASVNQIIGSKSLDKLYFKPASGCTESSFRFKSGGDYSMVCRLCYTDSVNSAPVIGTVTDAYPGGVQSVWTQADIATYGTLSASDPDGDEMVFEITSYPEKGILQLTNSSSGDYIYTPCEGLRGKDSFSYVVRDCYGNYSDEAVVTVEIDKRRAELVFADMEGHWAHNAALVMVSENAMQVRSAGGMIYFDPDDDITREDFIVTVMKALGSGEIEPCDTKFADNDAISTEASGYISRAAELGIIQGSYENGAYYFKPGDNITRAEAAVVLNSIIGADEPDVVQVFADDNSVPAWARGAMYALSDAGVFKGTGSGNISPNSVLSRGETAQILLTIKQLYE
ncbi:MAG: S-layer homology domain-containing protein [Eubacteriales bacterium]